MSGNAQDTKNVAYPVWTGNATFVDIVGFCLWIDLSRDESERLSWFDGTIAAFNLSLADVLCPVGRICLTFRARDSSVSH